MRRHNTLPSAPVSPGTALAALRSETAHQHGALEALPASKRILRNDLDLSDYRSTLVHLFGFYEPLARLAKQSQTDWAEHVERRVHDLACDLADLGISPEHLLDAPRCVQFPAIDTVDRALGCGYVIEGSALGGRVILRHLQSVFASQGTIPFRFYSGDGAQTPVEWRRFCAGLEANARDIKEVCRAATLTFTSMAAWLSETDTVAQAQVAGYGVAAANGLIKPDST